MEEIENGVRIAYADGSVNELGIEDALEVRYVDGKLFLSIDALSLNRRTFILNEGESVFLLAHCASWYEAEDEENKHVSQQEVEGVSDER